MNASAQYAPIVANKVVVSTPGIMMMSVYCLGLTDGDARVLFMVTIVWRRAAGALDGALMAVLAVLVVLMQVLLDRQALGIYGIVMSGAIRVVLVPVDVLRLGVEGNVGIAAHALRNDLMRRGGVVGGGHVGDG